MFNLGDGVIVRRGYSNIPVVDCSSQGDKTPVPIYCWNNRACFRLLNSLKHSTGSSKGTLDWLAVPPRSPFQS